MTFEELWPQIKGLPNTAILQLPHILSEETKNMLAVKSSEEVAIIISDAISEINKGSIETVDSLVKRRCMKETEKHL